MTKLKTDICWCSK